jgi:hypothetical protein
VAKSHANDATDFFTNIYDGKYNELPLGINFLFFSTYNCAASNNDRNAIAQEQERFLNSERTITIKGLHPLDTKIRLASNDNTIISIRSLLLLIPITTNNTPLFHGIDRQHNTSTPFILAKYPNHHSTELLKSIPLMDTAIKIRIHQDDHNKIFTNITEGLTFGAEFQNYKNKRILRTPQHTPSESSRLQIQNIMQIISSVAYKRHQTNQPHTRPNAKQRSWASQDGPSSNTTITSTSTSSSDQNSAINSYPNNPHFETFENKLAELQTHHINTNIRIDELDSNITRRLNILDDSIQSLATTSHQNFNLIMAQFGGMPTNTDTSNDTSSSLSLTEAHDHNIMDVDIDSRKRDRQIRSGPARTNLKK